MSGEINSTQQMTVYILATLSLLVLSITGVLIDRFIDMVIDRWDTTDVLPMNLPDDTK